MVQKEKRIKKSISIDSDTVTVFDVAKYIVELTGPISPMKLQLQVYYSQAWYYTTFRKKLFPEAIEAWRIGPFCRELHEFYRDRANLTAADMIGDSDKIPVKGRAVISTVILKHGDKGTTWLAASVQSESPWSEARAKFYTDPEHDIRISVKSMRDYYKDKHL